MLSLHYSGTQIFRTIRTFAPVLCLVTLSACSSINWFNFDGHNTANAATPAVSRSAHKNNGANNGGAMLALGKNFARQGDHAAAIPLFKSAYHSNSSKVEPLLHLGKSLMAIGRYDDALDALIRAKNSQHDNQEVLISLGKLHLALYKPASAADYFKAAITSASASHQAAVTTAKAYSGLGVALELTGDHQGAQEAFDAGLAMDASNMDLLSNKALSLALAGRAEEAVDILLTIVVQPQAQSQHRQNLSLAYAFMGDSKRAWQIASIDMTPDLAERTVASFYTLKGMEQESRMQALVYGMTAPRTDMESGANKVPLDPDGSEATARIARKEEGPIAPAEPASAPVVAQVVEEPKVERPTLPPLLDPRGWAVQIGAYRKPEEVIRGWSILRERYFDILGSLEPRRSEVSFGERQGNGPRGFYYRLNAGPLSGYRQSRDVCTALVHAGGECWIRPPEPSEGQLPE